MHSCAATPFTASSAVPCCQLLQSGGCPVHPLWWRLSCKTSWGQCNVPFPWAVVTCGVMFRLRKRSLRPAGLASPHCWGGAAPCTHHPSGGVGAQFLGPISSAANTPGCNGSTLLCFGASPFAKIQASPNRPEVLTGAAAKDFGWAAAPSPRKHRPSRRLNNIL